MISNPTPLPPSAFDDLIKAALEEDVGRGDRTTHALFPEEVPAMATIKAKEPIVVAGLWLVPEVFKRLSPKIEFDAKAEEGESVKADTSLAQLMGDGRQLLTGERVALNFLQRLGGIATKTAQFVQEVRSYNVQVLDTRKTIPGWRLLEKYAVRMGGGTNHRAGLDGTLLIKDNHLHLIGELKEAVHRAREAVVPQEGIEMEVGSFEEVRAALEVVEPNGADTIMLDNMSIFEIQEAMKMINRRVRVEVSGGVTLSNIREIAACGVDFISVGAITHSAKAVDISMDIVAVG